MGASVEVTGTNRVIRGLGKLGKFAPFADRIMLRWTRGVVRKLQATPYPPTLPNQKYIRTGTLKRSFGYKKISRARYNITNTAQQRGRFYPQYVIGTKQAKIHQGRWWLMRDVANQELPKLVRRMGAQVKDIWEE